MTRSIVVRAKATLHNPMACFVGMLLLCATLYIPGLGGAFFFDDFPNIVDNPDVHVVTLQVRDWRSAALSSPSSKLRRPLAMLSFAVNEYFTGSAPYPMKLTNLLIHLVNGVLLLLALKQLLNLWAQCSTDQKLQKKHAWLAAVVSGLWLLLPVNLSSVLYVVQRMESLAQTFVLLGLWQYLRGRAMQMRGEPRGSVRSALALTLGTLGGVTCKETAILLPLYAWLTEYTVLRFKAPSATQRRALYWTYFLLLALPALLGGAWLLLGVVEADSFAGRPFTMWQRVLTEFRIVTDYIGWTLFPLPNYLSFYHDDIEVSSGLLTPPQTIVCIVFLTSLLVYGVQKRNRQSLLSLGILWFFASHSLTATILPLELVFEHRNYFASIGLLLAASAILLQLGENLRLVRIAAVVTAVSLFSATTYLRAQEWSNPLRLAYAEAGKNIDSPRANYELGRMLIIASGYKTESPLVPEAIRVLERNRQLPGSGTLPEAALIVLAHRMHLPLDQEWWGSIISKLAERPPSQEDISALQSLLTCQLQNICVGETQQMLSAFLAALAHPRPLPRLLGMYADFSITELRDYPLAERLLTQAVAQASNEMNYQFQLLRVLILQDKLNDAYRLAKKLRGMQLNSAELNELSRVEQGLCSMLKNC